MLTSSASAGRPSASSSAAAPAMLARRAWRRDAEIEIGATFWCAAPAARWTPPRAASAEAYNDKTLTGQHGAPESAWGVENWAARRPQPLIIRCVVSCIARSLQTEQRVEKEGTEWPCVSGLACTQPDGLHVLAVEGCIERRPARDCRTARPFFPPVQWARGEPSRAVFYSSSCLHC